MSYPRQLDELTTIVTIDNNDYLAIFDTSDNILKKITKETLYNEFNTDLNSHTSNTSNPHSVVKSQLNWTGTAYTNSYYGGGSSTLNNYTPSDQSASYTGIDNTQVGDVYAQVSELEALRGAYENLRGSFDNVIQVVSALISELQSNNILT